MGRRGPAASIVAVVNQPGRQLGAKEGLKPERGSPALPTQPPTTKPPTTKAAPKGQNTNAISEWYEPPPPPGKEIKEEGPQPKTAPMYPNGTPDPPSRRVGTSRRCARPTYTVAAASSGTAVGTAIDQPPALAFAAAHASCSATTLPLVSLDAMLCEQRIS